MSKEIVFQVQVDARTIFRCPICGSDRAQLMSLSGPDPLFQGWCLACTNLRITHLAADQIRAKGKSFLLSAYLKDLPSEAWHELSCITSLNVEALADSVTPIPVVEQFDRLVLRLCEKTPRFGAPADFAYETDWPLIRARDANEALAFIKTLKAEGFLVADGKDGLPVPPTPTRKAFERYAELRNAGPLSQQAFVAMAFAPQYADAWDYIIKPGIESAGYRPFRVDKKEHADKIDDLIMAEIRRSKFLVADFTGQRGGVYFEAGFAHGLGRPVIWMCQEAENDKLHFDTRQYNHILYTDPTLAREQLKNRIVAIMGEGSYKPDSQL